jgi:hypothetical protein
VSTCADSVQCCTSQPVSAIALSIVLYELRLCGCVVCQLTELPAICPGGGVLSSAATLRLVVLSTLTRVEQAALRSVSRTPLFA